MKIDDEKLKKLSESLREKWKNRVCPMCQSGNWIIQENCFELREFNGGNLVIGGTVIPIVPIVCNNCSNTVFINAILSGVVSVDIKDGKNG
ncbi:MAG: hypothetical protein COY58_04165 [Gammaproteobacteria bacterium CG_4_10_14_0_8_um_filter_38_16]|nr:MAG: hypothetical protein COY58_04165 [Gammaproteobacteria bacterium CG_4_10_14_0_8_um_filter_38_16]PJA02702.1 MAG: hypothetical protein COX72_09015 [Gammaproteobacteria bacterium CG_4_10_14_0_2_um_filter_38_22]PJB09624.1 MAG: hypothetical protein CO120_09070 [Gammaproteobacteria bacterium CG_4_9_14_3_um_filter_38_9]